MRENIASLQAYRNESKGGYYAHDERGYPHYPPGASRQQHRRDDRAVLA
jgi:hypothetical protein